MASVNVADVRAEGGSTESLISNEYIQDMIKNSEKNVSSSLKIYTKPTKVIDIVNGMGKDVLSLNRPYVWKLLEVVNYNESLDLNNLHVNPISGLVYQNNSSNSGFIYGRGFVQWNNAVKVKYLSAFMEKTTSITESTADVVVGDSVVITVEDETIFIVDDWVLIEGTDGKTEAAQITAKATGQITVDKLVQTHESGSLIIKLQTHELFRLYVLYDVCTNVANYIVGNTSNLATSYSLPEYQVTKGVAYTHWREAADRYAMKRDEMKSKILSKLNPMS